jgi:hypothetical protein
VLVGLVSALVVAYGLSEVFCHRSALKRTLSTAFLNLFVVMIVPVVKKKKVLCIFVPCQYHFLARLSMDTMDGSGM